MYETMSQMPHSEENLNHDINYYNKMQLFIFRTILWL